MAPRSLRLRRGRPPSRHGVRSARILGGGEGEFVLAVPIRPVRMPFGSVAEEATGEESVREDGAVRVDVSGDEGFVRVVRTGDYRGGTGALGRGTRQLN